MNSPQNTLQTSLKNATLLKGHKDAILIDKEQIYKDVEQAKKWLVKKPDYLKFLQHLQHVLHQKNIGIFSELLTYFVKDVLNKDKEIALDLYTYHNLPALRIEAVNQGKRESIYEGNGGSIANIVSTGLRLISLSRMQNRKFIILDEPDCWLAPQHIPLFAKIIGEISQKLKIQTVLISHHKWEYFKNYGRVIELKKDGAHLTTEILHDTTVELYPDDYIKQISLKRVMSHYDTTYDLHPYLTCIVGENDIGKSVVGAAVKAVCYNDSSDSYIQHNENEAQVIFNLSTNTQILWQRFLTTNHDNPQKVKYSLFNDNIFIKGEYNADDCPEFVVDELKIALTEDIDIHIGNQKQPVFLLSSETKPQERAKILSLGKESLIIQKMMETIKSKTKQFQQIIKTGEVKYDQILKQLKHLENIEELISTAEKLGEDFITLEEEKIELISLNLLLEEYTKLSPIEHISFLQHEISIPELKDNDYLLSLIQQFIDNEEISRIEKISPLEVVDNLKPVDELEYYIKEIASLGTIAQIDLVYTISNEDQLKPVEEINSIIKDISSLANISNISFSEPVDYQLELKNIEEINLLIKEIVSKKQIMSIDPVKTILIPQLKDTTEILELIEDYEQAKANWDEWQVKSKRLDGWKIAIEQEIKEFLLSSGNKCPTCGQHLDAETIKEHLND